MGYVGGGEDAKTVSELMDYIRATVADCQVSGRLKLNQRSNY